GLINACHLTGRSLGDIEVVVNGAGAAAIACTELIKAMGVKGDRVTMCDRKGVIYKGRTDLDQWKSAHAVETDARTLADACVGATRAESAVRARVTLKLSAGVEAYRQERRARWNPTVAVMSLADGATRSNPKRVLFAAGEEPNGPRGAIAFKEGSYGTLVLVG